MSQPAERLQMSKPVSLLPFLSLAVVAALSPAQAAPNLTGEWKLNVSKSNYGPIPAPQLMVRKVRHDDPALRITTTQKGAQGEITTELTYTTDGKPAVNKVGGSEAKGAAHWQGDKLVIDSTREVQGNPMRSRETWSLSADGKVLTIATHLGLPQGEFDLTLVFYKQ
jgi:hypothetical protein